MGLVPQVSQLCVGGVGGFFFVLFGVIGVAHFFNIFLGQAQEKQDKAPETTKRGTSCLLLQLSHRHQWWQA